MSSVALHSLQGALGKTSGRSYKAAPRQLLQVDAGNTSPTTSSAHAHISKEDGMHSEGAAREAAKLGREALGNAAYVCCTCFRNALVIWLPSFLRPMDLFVKIHYLIVRS